MFLFVLFCHFLSKRAFAEPAHPSPSSPSSQLCQPPRPSRPQREQGSRSRPGLAQSRAESAAAKDVARARLNLGPTCRKMAEEEAVKAFAAAAFGVEFGEGAGLSDGLLICAMLHQVSPHHFDPASLAPVEEGEGGASNWALCLSNLKKVVRALDAYYKQVLGKAVTNIESVDLEAIAKRRDADEILNLMELVIGAAVMCEDKARFIKVIFSLESTVQTVLKSLIEQSMGRLQDYSPAADDAAATAAATAAAAAAAAAATKTTTAATTSADGPAAVVIGELQEVVRHLQTERQRLLADIAEQKTSCSAAQADADKLRAQVSALQSEKEASEGLEQRASSLAASQTSALQREVDELKRELDLKVVENDNLRVELKTSEQRAAASREMQAKLETESAALSDELDVLRDKAQRLDKAAAQLQKYQSKLEELPSLKKENKDLLERLDQYLDKIGELENAGKASATLSRMVEQYKDRAVEMERAKFEAVSAQQMQVAELERLRVEAEDQAEARRFLEEELAQTRQELEQLGAAAAGAGSRMRGSTSSFGGDSELLEPMETTASLREKLLLAQRELRALRAGDASSAAASSSSSSSATVKDQALPRNAPYDELLRTDAAVAVQELALVRAELEDALRAKREREDMLLALRKTHAETQVELQRTTKALPDGAASSAPATPAATPAPSASKAQQREAEAQLAQATNTIRLLEERLKEQEGAINKLEQDKDKLEVFSRSSLAAFKDKYLAELSRLKGERAGLELRLQDSEDRRKQSEATARTEQRLVLSAVYELGSQVIERALSGPAAAAAAAAGGGGGSSRKPTGPSSGASASTTFLGAQTAAQARVLDAQLLQTPPATPVGGGR